MKKILVGYLIDGKKSGIDKYLLNMLESLKGESCRIDFLTNEINHDLQLKLEEYGCRLYEIPNLKHPIAQVVRLVKLIKQNKYDVAYFNISEAFNILGLFSAYLCRVPRRIVHSHSSGCDSASKMRYIKIFIHKVAKQFVAVWANVFVSCSDKAAEWMFTKRILKNSNVKMIINGIDVKKFRFSEEERRIVRKANGWEHKKILLHVGNFLYVKNHAFLLDVIEKIQREEYLLVLVGDGPLKEGIEERVKERGLQKHVQFLGVRTDVNKIMQGSDFFLLPSHFEGLPLTAIEAQVAGNRCILSDKITREAKVGKNCTYLSIASAEEWAAYILSLGACEREDFVNVSGKKIDIREQKEEFLEIFG